MLGTEGFKQVCALACWTQETQCECYCSARDSLHFTADCQVLENDFNVFSAYGSRTSVRVSLLVGGSLDADVNVVFAGDGGRLIVADVAVKSFQFRLVVVYAVNITAEMVSFFHWLAPLQDDSKRLVLMGDWNAIMDPKIDKVRWAALWLATTWSTGFLWITQGRRCGRG